MITLKGALLLCVLASFAGCSTTSDTAKAPDDASSAHAGESENLVNIDVEDYAEPAKSDTQADELQIGANNVVSDFKELCKTDEGRRLILSNQDEGSAYDQRLQWEGMRMNGQATEDTFEEYQQVSLDARCSGAPLVAEFVIGLAKPLGNCNAIRFGPPNYDIDATVRRVQDLDAEYHTSNAPWIGSTSAERSANVKKRVRMVLDAIESNLKLSYLHTGCKVGNTGRCAASTGEKRVCERVFIYAPRYQTLVPDSLKGGQHIKEGPILQSPTIAWFRVGKTGHGENWGTATAESRFTKDGADTKARMDVDAIRRELVKQGLPVDRLPPTLPVPRPRPTPKPDPTPLPARITFTRAVRPGNSNFFDVQITNSGGSPATVAFRVSYKDGFFHSDQPWKEKATRQLTIEPGTRYAESFHDFHALGWDFKRL